MVTSSTFEPSASICFSTALEEPVPTAISTITEPTPIISPRIVRPERSLFAVSPRERDGDGLAHRRASVARVVDDLPVADADHAPGVGGDLVLVGDQDDRPALPVEAIEDLHHLLRGGGVEVAGRLVGEDHRRVGDERARDRDALLLAAGELGRSCGSRGRAIPTASSACSACSRRACAGSPA